MCNFALFMCTFRTFLRNFALFKLNFNLFCVIFAIFVKISNAYTERVDQREFHPRLQNLILIIIEEFIQLLIYIAYMLIRPF